MPPGMSGPWRWRTLPLSECSPVWVRRGCARVLAAAARAGSLLPVLRAAVAVLDVRQAALRAGERSRTRWATTCGSVPCWLLSSVASDCEVEVRDARIDD